MVSRARVYTRKTHARRVSNDVRTLAFCLSVVVSEANEKKIFLVAMHCN